MKVEKYRPRAANFFIVLIIALFVVIVNILLAIWGIFEKDILKILLPIPVIALMIYYINNILSYKIIMTDTLIQAPTGESVYKRYNKTIAKINFCEIENYNLDYERFYRMTYVYIVFKCNNGIAKIDVKLFSKKQIDKILSEINKRIETIQKV